MADNTELLNQAVAAAKQKDYASARRFLQKILSQEPNNLEAWLLAAHVVEKRSDAIICYKRVLQIDPKHTYAKQRLGVLQSEQPATAPVNSPVSQTAVSHPVKPPAASQPAMPASTPAQSAGESLPQAQRPSSTKQNSTSNLVILGGVVLIVVCIVIFLTAFALQSNDVLGLNPPTPTANELFAVLYKNARATNEEDIDAYMATIHPRSSMYFQTRTTAQQLFDMYDLEVYFFNLELISLTSKEAHIRFSLSTHKLSGPALYDNVVIGTMTLRPDNRVWKIYSQEVEDIKY